MPYAKYHRSLARSPGILRTEDGVFIPEDPESADWQAYLAWRAEGNIPTPLPVGKVPGSLSDPDAVKETSPWQKAISSPPETETPSSPPPTEPPTRKDPDGFDI